MNKLDIIHGDALLELQKIKNNSVDLIITDPPYNLGKDYGNNIDLKEFEEYLEFSEKWIKECIRVLKPHGTIYIFMGVRFISYIYEILERKHNLHFNSWITWFYTQGIGKTKGFSPRHDDILMFTKSKKFTFNLDDIRVPQKYYREKNNMRGANPGNVWEFSHVHYCQENRQNHPTQKPEGIIERMILASTNEGDTVLDPFSGSGTTLRVCQQLNRNGIGIEINPEYIEMTKHRLNQIFDGFDSVDLKTERIPLDLRKFDIRKEYLQNHIKWFLKNHKNTYKDFIKNVKEIYGDDIEIINDFIRFKTEETHNNYRKEENLPLTLF
jgi:site-specific DNA-methyltransferase (adenine-specific)